MIGNIITLVALVTGLVLVFFYLVRIINIVIAEDSAGDGGRFVLASIGFFAGLCTIITAFRAFAILFVFSVLSALSADAAELFCGIGDRMFCQAQVKIANKAGGTVHNHHAWQQVAQRLAREKPAVIRLEGQSQGCVSVLKIADYLEKRRIGVDTIVCLDGASVFGRTYPVPKNVRYLAHWRQSVGLGGAVLCHGLTEGRVCRERRGNTFIYEETIQPKTLIFDHYLVGMNAEVQRKAIDLLVRK